MLQVIVPADDLNLLTIEELRVAVGLEPDDDSQDEKLEALGERVSSMITSACNVASDGLNPPTLIYEECTETVRITSSQSFLFLSRRPVVAVVSLTEAGVTLAQDVDFELDSAAGKLTRLCSDVVSTWACGKIVVAYDAGFADVPGDLRAIAKQLAGGYWADEGQDPMEKSVNIPGVIATERWVDQSADSQMPADLMRALVAGGYVNRLMVG